MTDKLYVVGLTGPTGAGKTEVARVFEARGIPVIDADALARRVTEPGTPCLRALALEFGEEILRPDGTLNRRELAARAFTSPDGAKRLNELTHPPIIALTKDILKQREREGKTAAVIDAPLLFESGMDCLCDLTVAVVAPAEVRLRRILRRDAGLTEREARARMAAQQPEAFYTARAGQILRGDVPLPELREKAACLARGIGGAHG